MFIYNILAGILKMLLELFKLLLRKWLVLLIGLFVGLGLTYIVTKLKKPYFESDITLSSNVIANSEIIPYVNKLHTFCKDRNTELLEDALSGSGVDISAIKDIEAFWVVDLANDSVPDYIDFKYKHNLYDTVNVRMTDRFAVRMKVFDADEFGTLRNGIINYISSNPFFQDQNDLRLSHYQESLDRMVYDIYRLDSLQDVKYFEETRRNIPASSGQIVFMQEQTTQLLYNNILWLTDEVQELDRMASIFDDIVTTLVDFTPTISQKNSYSYYAVRIVPVVLLLTILLLLVVVYRKEMLKFIKS